jgi:hypothetical protein
MEGRRRFSGRSVLVNTRRHEKQAGRRSGGPQQAAAGFVCIVTAKGMAARSCHGEPWQVTSPNGVQAVTGVRRLARAAATGSVWRRRATKNETSV